MKKITSLVSPTILYVLAAVVLIGGALGYITWHGNKVKDQIASEEARRAEEIAAVQKAEQAKEGEDIKKLIADFGAVLKDVPLGGSKEIAVQAIKKYYAPFVSEGVMAGWTADPVKAPGRFTSSPWPDHIEITSIDRDPEDGSYTVQGNVIEVTSVEVAAGGLGTGDSTNGAVGSASKYQIAMMLRNQNGRWVITGFVKEGL